jgi:hypothetical protein
LFSTPTIWFSVPAELNDPFECRPWVTFNGSREQIIERLAQGLRKQKPELTKENATAHAVSIFLEGRHRNPKIWEQLREDLGDWLGRIGLYCLSGNNNSILMWSHYADHHRGYCLQFEATDCTPVFGGALRVRYASDFPVVDVFNMSDDEQANLVFSTKYLTGPTKRNGGSLILRSPACIRTLLNS